jgi:hypothetical protein
VGVTLRVCMYVQDVQATPWELGQRQRRHQAVLNGYMKIRAGGAGLAGLAGWRSGWWSVVLACSLGGSVGSGRLRGSDGPDRACLARLGSACDCVCLECVCVGRSLLKDLLHEDRKTQQQICYSVCINYHSVPSSRLARLLSDARKKVADPRDGLEKTYRSASLERR